MSQTVVALFENQTESHNAVQELMKIGMPQDRVDISKGYMPKDGNGTARNKEDKDSISEFFDALFDNDSDSKRVSEVARTCGSIVTVHAKTSEEARRAAQLLDQAGAVDLEELERRCGGASTNQPTGIASGAGYQQQAKPGTSIPIIEEDVQIGKREVATGGVRVKSWIVERPVQENLRLREEHVKVERNQVNRPASESDLNSFKEGKAEFIEHKEVPIVNKEANVVEEVRIGKEVEQRQQVVRETERRTEVDVQRMNGGSDGETPRNNNR